MKTLFLLCIALIPAGVLAAQPATEVRVRKLGPDSYEAVMTTSQTTDVAVAQNALIAGAKQLCKEKNPEFGRYSFETKEPLNKTEGTSLRTLVLKQEISCKAASTLQPQEQTSVAKQWKPTTTQENNIQQLTYQYFKNRDTGQYQQAFLLFAASFKASTSETNWLARVKQFNSKAGKPIKRQVSKITWYNHPLLSPTPGIYAAADYVSQFENIDIHCGYVMWHQQPDGSFQIVREEENFVDKATQSTMKDSDITKVKALYRCVAR